MSGLHIDISNLSIALNTIVRLLTAFIFLKFIIPLQFKETKVKNGLRKLRYQLLITGIILFHINTIGLIIIIIRFLKIDVTTASTVVTYFNTFGFLFIALVEYQIYHRRYTPKQKELHAKFEEMENEAREKEDKKLMKSKKK